MKIFTAIFNRQEYRARRDALIQLRAMTDRTLIDCNFSPELIKEGIKAWPWQNPVEEVGRLSLDCSSLARSHTQSVGHDNIETAVEPSKAQEQKEMPGQLARRNAA